MMIDKDLKHLFITRADMELAKFHTLYYNYKTDSKN